MYLGICYICVSLSTFFFYIRYNNNHIYAMHANATPLALLCLSSIRKYVHTYVHTKELKIHIYK